MNPMMNIAVKAARYAGNIINRSVLGLEKFTMINTESKKYFHEINYLAEKVIIDALHKAYPKHTIISQEIVHLEGDQNEFKWLVESLDGKNNLIHGLPFYAISIALIRKGQVIQAVIYDPVRNEIFTAIRGSGTFLNNRRIRVTKQIRLQDSLLSIYHPCTQNSLVFSKHFQEIIQECPSVRYMGSTVLEIAYVACGRLDGFVGIGLLNSGAMAAGTLMVLEAGGLTSDFCGEQDWIKSGNLIAGAPKIFTALLKHLKRSIDS